MEHDAWFFIGVFIFIFLVWVATGGPTHPISFTGPTLSLPGALGGGTYLSLPRAPLDVGSSQACLPGSTSCEGGPLYTGGGTGSNQAPTFTGGTPFGPISPFRGGVRFTYYVSGAGSADAKNEYLEISVPQNSPPVNISGWRLISEASGTVATIPKGTEVPISGTINAAEDIVLSPGTRAIIVSGRSPIGASFRENKCIGYFAAFQTFYPTLPKSCPVASDELAAHYGPGYLRDTACIEYARSLSRCQVVLTPPPSASGMCQKFTTDYLNYNGCMTAHRNDADFLGNTWRIYLGRTSPMWKSRYELVKLIDASGKTVDAFSY